MKPRRSDDGGVELDLGHWWQLGLQEREKTENPPCKNCLKTIRSIPRKIERTDPQILFTEVGWRIRLIVIVQHVWISQLLQCATFGLDVIFADMGLLLLERLTTAKVPAQHGSEISTVRAASPAWRSATPTAWYPLLAITDSTMLALFVMVGWNVRSQRDSPEWRPGMFYVSPLSVISGLSFDFPFPSPLLVFWLL